MALWDIKAKLAGEPLWRLLGARDRFVPGYASGLDIALDDDALADFYASMAERGFTSGKLSVIGHQKTIGKNPRNFVIDPSGRFLIVANQDTDDIYTMEIDQATGKLTPVGEKVEISMPVCLVFATER